MEAQRLELDSEDDRISSLQKSESHSEDVNVTPDSTRISQAESSENSRSTTAGASDAAELSEPAAANGSSANSMVLSSLLSLVVVLLLLIAVRLILPPLLESSRHSWVRGQLRAEFEASGQQLRNVSLESLSEVSRLVSKRAAPSVVHIIVRNPTTFLDSLANRGRNDAVIFTKDSQGSGVIVDNAGYVLTNEHVLGTASNVQIQLSDGRLVKGIVVGRDARTDLAVVKIDAPNLLAISWGDSEAIDVGSPVWALGSPFGLTGSITFGILSGKHRMNLRGTSYVDSSLETQARYGDLMQSDVAVNPGNSGGPLVNARGELVGVNTAILGESYQGVSFSIPSNVAKRVYESIKKGGDVQRGYIGVQMVEVQDDSSEKNGTRVMIGRLADRETSPAAMAGLQPYDILLEIAGKPIRSTRDVATIVETLAPGTQQTIRVERADKKLDFSVTIGTLQSPTR
jgi:S1-C subfamily serine protease